MGVAFKTYGNVDDVRLALVPYLRDLKTGFLDCEKQSLPLAICKTT